jgi:pimeloyl-ACP methyl ester carboxylesterase
MSAEFISATSPPSSSRRSTEGIRLALLAVVLMLVAAACGGSSGSSQSGVASASFEPGPCPTSVASLPELADAQCGQLVVPENRHKPNGKTIRLPVAIIPSVAQPPQHEPVVHMTGGPGGDALGEAQFLVPAGLNADRDLIIMGQRGTLDAEPELLCPEIDQFNAVAVGLVYDADSTGELHVAATKACHDRLVAEGIDLAAYNTLENVADFVDLRRVLKIPKWSIYGYSYGTYLALTMMRLHPHEIVSVMIDSVVPPSVASLGWTWSNLGEAFGNLFDACAAQPGCAAKYGDVRGKFTAQVQQLEANPLTTTGTYTPGGPPVKVVLDGGALVNWLVAGGLGFFVKAPSAIQELVDGNPVQIANSRAAAANPAAVSIFGYGLTYGVFCSEWIPFEPQSEILAKGLLAFPSYPDTVLAQAPQLPFETEDCAIWNVPKAPASIKDVTSSNIPTLVTAGSFDPKTSPMWAKYAATTLSNSTTIVVPGIGHWVLPQSTCAQSVLASFLANPNTPPDTSCVAELTPPPFN